MLPEDFGLDLSAGVPGRGRSSAFRSWWRRRRAVRGLELETAARRLLLGAAGARASDMDVRALRLLRDQIADVHGGEAVRLAGPVTWAELRAVLLLVVAELEQQAYAPPVRVEPPWTPWSPELGISRAEHARRVYADDSTLSAEAFGRLVAEADAEDVVAADLAEVPWFDDAGADRVGEEER